MWRGRAKEVECDVTFVLNDDIHIHLHNGKLVRVNGHYYFKIGQAVLFPNAIMPNTWCIL